MKKSIIYCSVIQCLIALSNQAFATETTEVITVKGTRTVLYDSRDVNVAAFGIKDL